MFTEEELNSWNELFPDCKISESYLSRPTEGFLIKVLVAYLRTFGFKIVLPLNMDSNDNSREKRLFLIKLTHQIEQILQITDKSYTFKYYDIIHPSPKKTSHMLGILLNYLYYYNMYKTEVFCTANEEIKKLQELNQCISTTKEQNEQLKDKSEKIIENITDYSLQLPKLKNELEVLKEENNKEELELQKIQDALKELCAQLQEMKNQKRTLEKQIVPDKEARELQTIVAKLEEDICERKRLQNEAEVNIKEQNEKIKILQELIVDIEKANNVFPLKLWDKVNEINKKLKETKRECVTAQTKNEDQMLMIRKQHQVIKSFNDKLKLKQEQLEHEQKEETLLIANKEKQCFDRAKQLECLNLQDRAMDCLLEEQNDISKYLKENLNEILHKNL